MPTQVYIALGANLGDREQNLRAALDQLARHPQVELRRISPLIETDAVGGPDGSPPYLNAAAELATTLRPAALLDVLMDIERSLGRTRRERWEPRPIDLDILLFGDQIVSTDALVIPHPLMHERRFVLEPLAAIAPDAVHPVLQMSVLGLLENLDRRHTP